MTDGDAVRRASRAMISHTLAWPVVLIALILQLRGYGSGGVTAAACALALVAMIEVARHASAVVAARSWSRPAGAWEASRFASALTITIMLGLAVIPLLGALAVFGFDEVTAQVDSPRTSYQYRIEYGDLRPRLRRTVVVISAESTIGLAAIVALLV